MCLENALCLSECPVFPFGASEVPEFIFVLLILFLSSIFLLNVFILDVYIYVNTYQGVVWRPEGSLWM